MYVYFDVPESVAKNVILFSKVPHYTTLPTIHDVVYKMHSFTRNKYYFTIVIFQTYSILKSVIQI